jgi:GxxExxY protein
VIEDQVIVELKTVERLMPIHEAHEAQMLTYLRLSAIRTGLLLNFNSAVLKDGTRRLML